MPISVKAYLDALRNTTSDGTLPLNTDQERAIRHNYTEPLWVIAGPGTGKTHTLAWLVFKRILVDDIPPHRVFLTTFTRKAAAELESRLLFNCQKLIQGGLTEAEAIDVLSIQVGTLHGLCSRILQDQRYDRTLRIRILEDELTQQFFIRRSNNLLLKCDDISFWDRFGFMKPNDRYPPTTAKRAENVSKLFNRMTENDVDLSAMLASGDPDFTTLAQAYQAYQQELDKKHRTDQAHLQRHFLDFLNTPQGAAWLGSGLTVLVDEYQDTNPIQEQIYFKLTGTSGDLTVVGDDDQSLYRFRGATVEALVDFDHACTHYLSKTPTPVYLHENRRSHPKIVEWVNRFITYHPEMSDPRVRVRAPGKPPLVCTSDIRGNYPAVMAISRTTNPLASQQVAAVIQDLVAQNLIEDLSQIALLTFSTRETIRGISAYTDALSNAGIPFYNPRNRIAQRDQRFQEMIGALCWILDPSGATPLPASLPRGVPEYIAATRNAFQDLIMSGSYPDLGTYVSSSQGAIQSAHIDPAKSRNYLTRTGGRRVTLSHILYKLLAHEPFATSMTDPAAGERLKALNLILSEYESLYDDGELKIETGPTGSQIEKWTLYNIQAVFIEGIHDGLNDPEDDEVSVQEGLVNVMTIHQSKGLEFEVVFVLRPDKQPFLGDTHALEDTLDPYVRWPTKPAIRRPARLRAAEDAVRLFFVAYSRAKRLLILTGTQVRDWDRVLGQDGAGAALNQKSHLQRIGVHFL